MRLRDAATSAVRTAVILAGASLAAAQSPIETFSGTAQVKTAAGAAAKAPVTIVVERTMPQAEVEGFVKAFTSGGAAALRKALTGVAPTGSIKLGELTAPTRLTLERVTDKGRLLTIVTDRPLLFLGGGRPDAKTKEGYDFAIIDLEVDSAGRGSGMLAPAAKVTVKQGVFVVQDYGAEAVRLVDVSRTK
jgi:hypothetical protein